MSGEQPSLTDLLQAALANAFESQRESFDRMSRVSQVQVTVHMDTKRNLPNRVVIRPEIAVGSCEDGRS